MRIDIYMNKRHEVFIDVTIIGNMRGSKGLLMRLPNYNAISVEIIVKCLDANIARRSYNLTVA